MVHSLIIVQILMVVYDNVKFLGGCFDFRTGSDQVRHCVDYAHRRTASNHEGMAKLSTP